MSVFTIQLQDSIKCPGCNWTTTELYIEAVDKEAAKEALKAGEGCCSDCHAGDDSTDILQEEVEVELKAYRDYHGR